MEEALVEILLIILNDDLAVVSEWQVEKKKFYITGNLRNDRPVIKNCLSICMFFFHLIDIIQ